MPPTQRETKTIPPVLIRPAHPQTDAAPLAAIYAPYVQQTAITFEETVPGPEEFARRMVADHLPWFVAEQDGKLLGYASASKHRVKEAYRWSADTSVYIAAGAHRQGIGRGLYERLIAETRALGYVNLLAGITVPNPSSTGLHAAMGFVEIGTYPGVGFKLGAWRDVAWWQLRLCTPPSAPPDPRPWFPGG
jgi:phosphinothricin acetyltransferase